MLKEEASGGDETTGGSNNNNTNWARICDTCRSAPCTVYCHADSAYLCTDCDARIHAANQVASRHERVWICEACERMPAAFLCKADAASLCASCDADIHSANPLARRHHRVPIHPISGSGIYGGSGAAHRGGGRLQMGDDGYLAGEGDESFNEEDEDEAASWLLTNPVKNNQNNSGYLLGGDVDDYLNLVEYNSGVDGEFSEQYNQQQQQYTVPQKSFGVHADSVVPVRTSVEGKDQVRQQNVQTRMDYDTNSAYSYNASISQSVSVSSIDAGVVPESTTSTVSHSRPPKGTIDLFQNPPVEMPTQLTPMDRVARVLRYREKKKNRKFEKTIRYASRKAYAETRPRIKGRFAKRTDVEVEMEQIFANNLIGDGGYGIVPSY